MLTIDLEQDKVYEFNFSDSTIRFKVAYSGYNVTEINGVPANGSVLWAYRNDKGHEYVYPFAILKGDFLFSGNQIAMIKDSSIRSLSKQESEEVARKTNNFTGLIKMLKQ